MARYAATWTIWGRMAIYRQSRGLFMRILETDTEVEAVTSSMNPVAQKASALLTCFLLEHPQILESKDDTAKAFAGACCFAMEEAGYDLENDRERIGQFYEDNADAIMTVAISITYQAARQRRRDATPSWIGKAVAFGAGALIASLLGG